MILSEHQNNASLGFKFARAVSNPVCLCLLLAAVTLVVYWPVTRCDFVNYDDPDYFTSNPHVLAGLTAGECRLGFYHQLRCQLASADVAVVDAGCEIVWPRTRRAALHKPVVSRRQHGPAFSVVLASDWGDLAERLRGRAVRFASVACRIRGVDFGAQGCLEHVFRVAGALDYARYAQQVRSQKSRSRKLKIEHPASGLRCPVITGWHCFFLPSV